MSTDRASELPDDAARGLELAVALDRIDFAQVVDAYEVLEVAAAARRLVAWASSLEYDAVAEFARRPDDRHDAPATSALGARVRGNDAAEVAARLRITPRKADDLLDVACTLAARLPGTRAALADGDICPDRAAAMVTETADLDAAQATTVEAAVLARGPRQTPAGFRAAVRKRALAADPRLAQQRVAKARADRCVRTHAGDWDSTDLYAKLPAEHAVVIDTVLTAAARRMAAHRAEGDDRTMDQLRADALLAPFVKAITSGVLDGVGPVGRLELVLRASTATLAGDADEPGDLDGHGPITADLARHLATHQHLPVRVLVTDQEPTAPPDTDAYRPSPRLAQYVRDRDRTCVAPGCARSSAHCDLDHTIPWPQGPTSHTNLGPLCRRHHRMKQHPGYRLEQPRPGRFRWTYPTGHTYDITPDDRTDDDPDPPEPQV